MSKITLQFDIPEEDDAALVAVNSQRLKNAIVEYDNRLRSVIKHGCCVDHQQARDMLWECIRNEGLENLFN